jgi:hypothetical protein
MPPPAESRPAPPPPIETPPAPSAPAKAASVAPRAAPPVSPKPPAPRAWNLGAGFGFDPLPGLDEPAAEGAYLLSAAPLPLRLSLEKSLGATTWLMLNGAFSHSTEDVFVTNLVELGESRTISLSENAFVATVGVRQIVVSGLVDFSVFGGLEVGNAWVDGESITAEEFAPGPQAGSSTLIFGILAGIAVERELVESLSLRVPIHVASVTWMSATTARVTESGIEETDLERSAFSLVMSPAIELRLYF